VLLVALLGVHTVYRVTNSAVNVTIFNDDCFDAFAGIPDSSVDAVVTDPPYFLDQLASDWSTDTGVNTTKNGQVSSLPAGMKFDPAQGRQFEAFMYKVSLEALRVLKPGGFFLSFSAPRLYHRLGVAVEDAGFNLRDMWSWLYTQNQVKAMSVRRFLNTEGLTKKQVAKLDAELSHWKTPQIKSCIEPITCAQKPPEGTFLNNWMKHGVGLVDVAAKVGADSNMIPANVMTTDLINDAFDKSFLVPKPSKAERGGTSHVSVKPLALMDQLVRLTTPAGATVLDPFNGSGSTGISAVRTGRNYIGFELSPIYFKQTLSRFDAAFAPDGVTFDIDAAGTATATVELDDRSPSADPEADPHNNNGM